MVKQIYQWVWSTILFPWNVLAQQLQPQGVMAPKAMKKSLAQKESKGCEDNEGKALVKRKSHRIQQRQTSCQKRPKESQTEKRQPSQIGEAHSGWKSCKSSKPCQKAFWPVLRIARLGPWQKAESSSPQNIQHSFKCTTISKLQISPKP